METHQSYAKSSLSYADLVDRMKGCIYGAALGDAFGLSTEFMTKVTATHLYGVGPIQFGTAKGFEFWRDGHRRKWLECDFTDDTDQLLLLLQSVLENKGDLIPTHFAYRLLEWSKSGFPELRKPPCGIGFTVGSVLSHPDFLQDPHKASFQVWHSKNRNLAANGAVMRTAVLGIPSFWNEEAVAVNAIKAAKVTHADPRSVNSAIIVSVIVSRLLRGENADSNSGQSKLVEVITQELLNGTGYEREPTCSSERTTTSPVPKPLPTVTEDGNADKGFLSQVFKKLNRSKKPKSTYMTAYPEYPELDRARGDTAAKLPETMSPKIESFGEDDYMSRMCRQVVEDYSFMLSSNPLIPLPEPEDVQSEEKGLSWVEELRAHCFPESLGELKLDEKQSIGYTLKCLGSAVYSVTRSQPADMTAPDFFKTVITELTLEAGDADTNCTVAGALLGCRLGKRNLPLDWLDGLRNSDFLDQISNELVDLLKTELNLNQQASN